MTNNKPMWIAQIVPVSKTERYLAVYFYIEELPEHPVSNAFFTVDDSGKIGRQLSPYKLADAMVTDKIISMKEAVIPSQKQLKYVQRWVTERERKFKSYLLKHKQYGEVLDYAVVANRPMALVFNGNALSKLYMFDILPDSDFELMTPNTLDYFQLLTALSFLTRTYNDGVDIPTNMFIQVAQNMFLSVKKSEKQNNAYIVAVAIWDTEQDKAKMYTNTVLKAGKIAGQADSEEVTEAMNKLNLALKVISEKSLKNAKASEKNTENKMNSAPNNSEKRSGIRKHVSPRKVSTVSNRKLQWYSNSNSGKNTENKTNNTEVITGNASGKNTGKEKGKC